VAVGQLPVARVRTQYAWYTVGVLLQKIAAFALVPVYTAYLSTTEYGTLELLYGFLGLIGVFVAAGVPSAINKCYHRDCRTEADRHQLIGTAVLFTVATLSIVVAGGLYAEQFLTELVLGRGASVSYLRLALACLVLSQTVMIALELSRTVGRAGQYVAFSLLQVAVQITISVVLIVRFGLGVTGILVGNLLAYGCVQLASLPFLLRHCRLRFSWLHLSALTAFGVAMIPVSLAGWVTNVSDRFFLQHYASASDVGVYALGYKFGVLIEIAFILPFQKAWNPVFFSVANRDRARLVLGRTLTYYFGALCFGVAALTVAGDPLVRLMAHPDFHGAARVIPLIALAYLLGGVASYLGTGLIVANRTHVIAVVMTIGAIVNIGLNVVLIPAFGMMGAAVATIASFASNAALVLWAVSRWYPIRIESDRLLRVAAAVLAPLLLGSQIHCASPVCELLLRSGVMLTAPLLLLAIRFPNAREQLVMNQWRTRYLGWGRWRTPNA
jgi:O-antigen/teichoic acid export membrane protein